VILIVSDNNYGLIKWKQERSKGSSVHTALNNPDFMEYAKSFGIPAYAPRNVEELERDLAEALTQDTVTVVAANVNPDVNLELSQKLDTDLCAAFSLPE
jgi:acetolactate synthase-1/2/3 large subunit